MPAMPETIRFGDLLIPEDLDVLYSGSQALPLEPCAVRLLRYLVRQGARVVSKQELLERVWPDVVTSDGVIKRAVSLARRALRQAGPQAGDIRTHHRRGYSFVVSDTGHARALTHPPAERARTSASTQRMPNFDVFVGRVTEQDFIATEFERALQGQARPVLVLGQAGSGKTRLARQVAADLRPRGVGVLVARFRDDEAAREAPCGALLLGLAETLDVPLADLRAAVRARLDLLLPEDLFAARASERVPAASLAALANACVRASQPGALLLVLDDLQWAPPRALELVEHVLHAARGARLLLLALARREDAERPGGTLLEWLKRQATGRTFVDLRLGPWSCADLTALVAAACQTRPDDTPLHTEDLEHLHRVAGGNPHDCIELLRGLVLEGHLRPALGPGRHWVGDRLDRLALPSTLVLAAQVRLETLRPEVRACLDAAAVLGDRLCLRVLATVSGYDIDRLDGLAREAEALGVLIRRDLGPGEDYRFDPALLRQVIYDVLAPERRRELHARAARALSVAGTHEPAMDAAAIGMHHERAGDAESAFTWSQRAWQAAAARGAWRAAHACVERTQRAALELEARAALPAASRLAWRLQAGESLRCVGLLPGSEQMLLEAFSLAEAKGLEQSRADALVQLGRTRLAQGRYADARPCFERALDLLRHAGLPPRLAACLADLAALRIAQGDYAEVAELLTAELPRLGETDAREARGLLGWALALGGRAAEGTPLLRRALDACVAAGDSAGQALLSRRLHWSELSRGRYRASVAYATQAIAVTRARGDTLGEAKARMGVGQCLLAMGRVDQGRAWIERAQRALAPLGDRHCSAEALWLHGQAQREAGRLESASSELAEALEVVRSVGDRDDEFRVLIDIARVENAAGRPWSARREAELAATIAGDLRNGDGLGAAQAERAEAARLLGDLVQAESAAREAVGLLDGSGAAERWRAHAVLGRTLLAGAAQAAPERRAARLGAGLAKLRRAAELLHGLHAQAVDLDLEPEPEASDGHALRPRSWSVLLEDTRATLLAWGREAEATALAQRWGLEVSPQRGRAAQGAGTPAGPVSGTRDALDRVGIAPASGSAGGSM